MCDKVLACSTDSVDVVGVFEGEDLVGEIDLARSVYAHRQPEISKQGELSQQHLAVNRVDLPARRACRSFLPCKISSSSFLFLSSSSWSRLSPNSLILCKKSFTSSEPSAEDILNFDTREM